MIPPKRLLVATDFSAGADLAVDTAIDLAARWDAHIDWVHVGPEASNTLTPSGDALASAYVEHERQDAVDRKDALIAKARAKNVESEFHLAEGRPEVAVQRCAEELSSDWVVVGTHGRSGIRALLLGSVAEKIIRTSRVTTLSVRSGPPLVAGGSIVYGEDLSGKDTRATAAQVAAAIGGHLVAVHSVEAAVPLFADAGFIPPPSLVEASISEAKERLEELRGEYGEAAETQVSVGAAAAVLCDAARRRNAMLVVTGASTRSGLDSWLLGRVADQVLRHAPCSVLTVK